MSKKRFSEGWGDLFADTASDEQRHEEDGLLSLPDRRKTEKTKPQTSRSSGKNFSDSLDIFLQEAMENEGETEATFEVPTNVGRRRRRIKGGGLNSLLRNTLDQDSGELPSENTRRLTLLVSREKLDQLKKVAKAEKVPLRDLVLDIIGDYIRTKGDPS